MVQQTSEEVPTFGQVWEKIAEFTVTIAQKDVCRTADRLSHLVPGSGGLSTSYLSQLLNPEKYKKTAAKEKLAIAALALQREYTTKRPQFSETQQETLDGHFHRLLASLNVDVAEWTDPDLPLAAYSENRIVLDREEQFVVDMLKRGRMSLSIRGGYRAGKSTLLARVASAARGFGYAVHDCDASELAGAEGPDEVFSGFATLLRSEQRPSHITELNKVIEEEVLGARLGPTMLLIDDFNTLLGALGDGHRELYKALARGWVQKSAREPTGSPWRNLSIVTSATFAPKTVKGVAIASAYPAATIFDIIGFEPDDAIELIKVWTDFHPLGRNLEVSSDEVESRMTAVVDWFSGHRFLVHDYARSWVDNPNLPPPSKDCLTVSQAGFIDDLGVLLALARQSSLATGETTIFSLAKADPVTIRVSAQVLANIGVIDPATNEWKSPFIEANCDLIAAATES